MSGFKGMMKDGWHPKGKEGGKESWRGDFKGINQVVSVRVREKTCVVQLLNKCAGGVDGQEIRS